MASSAGSHLRSDQTLTKRAQCCRTSRKISVGCGFPAVSLARLCSTAENHAAVLVCPTVCTSALEGKLFSRGTTRHQPLDRLLSHLWCTIVPLHHVFHIRRAHEIVHLGVACTLFSPKPFLGGEAIEPPYSKRNVREKRYRNVREKKVHYLTQKSFFFW